MTKKVPKIALSPAKNEVLHEKPKSVVHEGILISNITVSNFTKFLNPQDFCPVTILFVYIYIYIKNIHHIIIKRFKDKKSPPPTPK